MAVPKQSRKELVAAKAQIDPAWDPELSAGQRHLAEHLEEAQRVLKRRSGGRKAVVVTVLGALALGFCILPGPGPGPGPGWGRARGGVGVFLSGRTDGYVFHSVSQEWFFGDREEAAAGADREAKSATS